MNKNNKKTVIVFFSFAVGIALYFAFLISNNHILTQEIGVFSILGNDPITNVNNYP